MFLFFKMIFFMLQFDPVDISQTKKSCFGVVIGIFIMRRLKVDSIKLTHKWNHILSEL